MLKTACQTLSLKAWLWIFSERERKKVEEEGKGMLDIVSHSVPRETAAPGAG